jgi:hypothetical protein
VARGRAVRAARHLAYEGGAVTHDLLAAMRVSRRPINLSQP